MTASASFYQALIEQTSDLVSVLAADGTILYASPSHRMLGYEPSALCGKNVFDFVHDDDLSALRERFWLAATSPGRTTSGQYHFRHADGSWRTLEAVATNLLADPSVAGIVVNTRDVTDRTRVEIGERQRAEQSLRRSEERYRHLVENINEVIFTVDATGCITYISPAIERVTGGPADEVIGRAFLDFIHPDDKRVLHASFERLLGGLSEPLEYRIIGNGGEVFWMRSQSQAVVEEGRVIAVQGVLTDVTTRRRAEMEARQHRESLAHVQRLTTAGEMTAEIAHQINQPLAAIVNFAGGLAARLGDGKAQPEVMREVATRIVDEARRASEVIRSLRAFLRKGESARSDGNLNYLVRHVFGLLEEDFHRERVDVRFLLDPALPMIPLDAILIEQVILNLLRNALDALVDWDGPRRVEIETRFAEEMAYVTITDTGVGLPSDSAARIFEAFFTTKVDGLGLGLSVSRSIVQASGGRLWAVRNPEGGTTVGFALPAGADPHAV